MIFNKKQPVIKTETEKLIINKGSKITGTIDCPSLMIICGDFEGTINTKSLEISESGTVKGAINAETVTVAGKVEANLKCTGRLRIEATGKVSGEVQYGALAVALGGVSVGNLEQTANMRVVSPQANLSSVIRDKQTTK
jgi:cytoskeletal protein CcmA (bactofilin family)